MAHNRNADWAGKAVRESVSATEQEAQKLNVIEIIATDLDDLLARLDGRQITIFDGSVATLKTRDVPVSYNRMNIVEDFLFTISDSNIAYLLLTLGTLGIIAEIFSPGLISPGVIGGISLLLGFYALGHAAR